MTVCAFRPVFGIGMLRLIIMPNRRGMRVGIGVSALAGMGGISTRFAGRLRHGGSIRVRMADGKLRNDVFFRKTANGTGERYHTVSRLGCFFRNASPTEGMPFRIKLFITAVAANDPVLLLVVFNLAGFVNAVAAFGTVMASPFCAFGTDTVTTAERSGGVGTTIGALFAVRADIGTMLAFMAFLAEACAVGAILAAVLADDFGTVAAIIAVDAHAVGAVDANTAIGTEFIQASGAFTTALTDVFGAIGTNAAAVLTDLCAVTALTAFFTVLIVCTFPADIAGGAEFVTAH